MKRLLVLSLLAAGCAPSIGDVKRAELTALACDADRLCQADGNLSEENFPLMPHHDAACVNFARTWLQTVGAACGASR